MNTIYLDTLFLINLLTDYITLLTTAKICGAGIKRPLLFIASIVGGAYAVLCTYHNNTWIDLPIMKYAAAGFICIIAFHKENRFLPCYVSFILVSAIFGGLLSAFVVKSNHISYIPINKTTLIAVFITVYALLTFYYRNKGKQTEQSFYTVQIHFKEETVFLTALRDTGNELYEPISNLPVLIVDKQILAKLIPELMQIPKETDLYDTYLLLSETPTLKGKLRLIPYQSISGSGILLGFIPDSVWIDQLQKEMVVAYSESKLSQTAQYQGIF